MELKELQSFLKVVELGSFSRASLELRIAQPALSRQVKKLEDEMGVELLYRNGRGVSVTPAGELLVETGRKLVADANEAVTRVRLSAGQLSGSATLGMPPTVGRVLSVELAEAVRVRHPMLRLRIVETFSGNLIDWLYSGRVDVGILYAEPNIPVMIAEPVVEERLLLLGTPALMSKVPLGPIAMSAASGLPLVAPGPAHSLRAQIESCAIANGTNLSVRYEIDSLYSMVDAVRRGLAFTILPACAAQDDIDTGALETREFIDPAMSRLLYVATASQRASAVASRHIAQIVRELLLVMAREGLWTRCVSEARKQA